MRACPRCDRATRAQRATCLYCGGRLDPRDAAPRRTLRARRYFVALLPGQAHAADIERLAYALDVSEFHANQLLRRLVPVVFQFRHPRDAAALTRGLAHAGVEAVRFTQADIDAVPAPRDVATLTVVASGPGDGSPYRSSTSGYVDALDVTGAEHRVFLRDIRAAVVGDAPHHVIDLYGDLLAPLRLRARYTTIRGLGLKDFERTAALSRFETWLPTTAPHIGFDRGFKHEATLLESERSYTGASSARERPRDWDAWSTRTWVVRRLRDRPPAPSADEQQRQHKRAAGT